MTLEALAVWHRAQARMLRLQIEGQRWMGERNPGRAGKARARIRQLSKLVEFHDEAGALLEACHEPKPIRAQA